MVKLMDFWTLLEHGCRDAAAGKMSGTRCCLLSHHNYPYISRSRVYVSFRETRKQDTHTARIRERERERCKSVVASAEWVGGVQRTIAPIPIRAVSTAFFRLRTEELFRPFDKPVGEMGWRKRRRHRSNRKISRHMWYRHSSYPGAKQ